MDYEDDKKMHKGGKRAPGCMHDDDDDEGVKVQITVSIPQPKWPGISKHRMKKARKMARAAAEARVGKRKKNAETGD